ncbi:hypothetical protein M9H77_23355 [Catharanthus roseus]|uniref:Uncharacterized protein n=1 Tax=Catharanthus roseus TaxID=4058 RepID=A0ACC0ASN7_CATRO|nr:hypothetical protein M9H77_23355 [Catharanthus roseus]
MPVQNFDPFHESGHKKKQPTRGEKRGDLGGKGYHKPQQEISRHKECHGDYLFEYYEENPNVGQANYGGYYGGQQRDKALDKIKWKVPSFKERQVENLFTVRNYSDIVKVKIFIAEFSVHIKESSKTHLSSSRSVVPKPQESTYKDWPKKDKTHKVVFKDNSRPKVEEKSRLITNPTRCFKCNGWGHIAINCPTKRALVFCEDLNGWIKKDEDDCQ